MLEAQTGNDAFLCRWCFATNDNCLNWDQKVLHSFETTQIWQNKEFRHFAVLDLMNEDDRNKNLVGSAWKTLDESRYQNEFRNITKEHCYDLQH